MILVMSEKPDPLLGTVLDGRYEITEFIAEGGMGKVYKAVQRTLDRTVAVKLLKNFTDGASEFQRRFFLEASLCARLSHPNTIRIFDYGCHEETTFYIVMEYLEGVSVRKILRDAGPLEPERALAILSQVCAALIEAHDSGLVHRDLKPSNLFAVSDGMGGEHIKILDFGVVKQMAANLEITRVQSILGSPQYMSPEQVQGTEIDGRSDLYSLGAILFQLLSGRVPFSGRDPMSVVVKHITDPVPAIYEINPAVAIPADVEGIVRRAMAKAPADRFASARDMLATIQRVEAAISGTSDLALARTVAPEADLPASIHDMPTGVMDTEVDCMATNAVDQDNTLPLEDTLGQLAGVELEGYKAFIDLNCPYCYALFERISRWGVAGQIEWCMIEHSSHVLEGGFDLHQEELLSNEVFEVHHRAPDIDLSLPPERCQSTKATWLLAVIHRLFPEKANPFRRSLYAALWQFGRNIGDVGVLLDLLAAHGMPVELLSMCEEPPDEFKGWQAAWEQGDFDFSIPVLTHPASGRVLIGLADQSSLAEFLLGDRMRVIDRTVCFYQRKPSVLLCGWMSHVWTLLEDVKTKVEIIQAPTARRASEMLSERAVPELLIIEDGHVSAEELETLGRQARARSVPWVVATTTPSTEAEIDALSAGAIEYLPLDGDARIARARFGRILKDRFQMSSQSRMAPTDALTRLPTRRVLLERMEEEWERALERDEPLSLVLLNLDGFKAYNKHHGYLSGDEVLIELARNFQREVSGRGQQLARFSGNEFAALLPRATAHDASGVAQRMLDLVQSLRIQNGSGGDTAILKASIGVHCVVPAKTASVYELVDGAHRDLKFRRSQA